MPSLLDKFIRAVDALLLPELKIPLLRREALKIDRHSIQDPNNDLFLYSVMEIIIPSIAERFVIAIILLKSHTTKVLRCAS